MDGGAYSGGTFQSNNQKVVQNKRGVFMTHNIRRYWGIHHAQSADGGTTWTTFNGTPPSTTAPE